jgi:hypothetical protein
MTLPKPRARAPTGTRLSRVASNQFQLIDYTTIGTIHGRRSRILNRFLPGKGGFNRERLANGRGTAWRKLVSLYAPPNATRRL